MRWPSHLAAAFAVALAALAAPAGGDITTHDPGVHRPVSPKPAPVAPAPVEPAVATRSAFDGATFLLPAGTGVGARWILPPTDQTRMDAIFSVGPDGAPLLAFSSSTGGTRLIDPGRPYIVDIDRSITHMIRTADGDLLLASGNELGLPALAPSGVTKEGLPVAAFQPLAVLPLRAIDALGAAGNEALAAGVDPQTGRSAVYRLRKEPGGGPQDLVLAYLSAQPITAVTGTETDLYVATGRTVSRVSRADGKAVVVYTDPSASVTGLVATSAGLFVSTGTALVLAGPTGALTIMRSAGHQIAKRGDAIYVLFNVSLGVAEIDNLADLGRFNLAVQPVNPGERTPPLSVASMTFSSGDGAPAASFDPGAIKVVTARIDLAATPGLGDNSPHTATVAWFTPLGARMQSTNFTVAAAQGQARIEATIGGEGDPGYAPPHWAGRYRFTDTLGNRYPGPYRVTVAVDGIPAGEGGFAITGTATADKAISVDDIARLKDLLAHGLSARSKIDGTPILSTAVVFGTLQSVKLLLDKGADANATDKDGDTPLAVALGLLGPRDWQPMADLLIQHGADVNATLGASHTPLLLRGRATLDPRIMLYLIRHGARIEAPPKAYQSALSSAVEGGAMCTDDLITALVQHGAKLNAPLTAGFGGIEGRTPLGTAIAMGDADCVALLLSKGATTKLAQHYGSEPDRSALYLALQPFAGDGKTGSQAAIRIVRLLLAKGATVADDEVYMMFRGSAPALFDLGTLARGLDRETYPNPYYGMKNDTGIEIPNPQFKPLSWHMGLTAALASGDPSIRDLGLRRALKGVRDITATAIDESSLGAADDVCERALSALEADYAPMTVDVQPDWLADKGNQPGSATLDLASGPRKTGGRYVIWPDPAGAAARAGLRPGDIIRLIDGMPINTGADITTAMQGAIRGTPVKVGLLRGDALAMPDLTLACGLVEHELGQQGAKADLGVMHLSQWLSANPDAPQAAAVRAMVSGVSGK